KKTPERAWLSEVSYDMLVQSLRDLHTAYRAFFSSIAGKRKGPKVAPPKFKSLKDTRQSIRFPRKGFVIRPNGRLYLSKIGADLKKTPERAWLSEVSYEMLVQSLRDLHTAYRAFFSSIAGKRKGPKVAPPKFKSLKDTRQSIRFPRKGFVIRPNGRLYLSKIG